jgi:hypothetical protein
MQLAANKLKIIFAPVETIFFLQVISGDIER